MEPPLIQPRFSDHVPNRLHEVSPTIDGPACIGPYGLMGRIDDLSPVASALMTCA
jgi:hypothetical protein